jgi:hypothetical protein
MNDREGDKDVYVRIRIYEWREKYSVHDIECKMTITHYSRQSFEGHN